MDIHTNISLKNFTTMRLGGNARFMAEARTPDDIATIYKNAKKQGLPIFPIGEGSNVIASDKGFDGVIIHIKIPGFQIVSEDINSVVIKIGAGEKLDDIIAKTVKMRLSGLEAMSNIPGTVGAAPIQNVGAYGQEIADTFISLEAFDTRKASFVTLSRDDCKFGYRNSIFRSTDKNRYIVCSITLKLSKNQPQPPFYDALQKYLEENKVNIVTVDTIRQAIIAIRLDKLPDPKTLPNSGSFFKNAIVENWQLSDIKKIDANVPIFNMSNGKYKIPTGWMIEKAGLKGALIHGMRVHDKNALVLINESATSYHDLELARNEITKKIRDMFRVEIEQEPLEI